MIVAIVLVGATAITFLGTPSHANACAISGGRIANCGGVTSSPTGSITCVGHTRTVVAADGRTVIQPNSC
jgi:hypothetical protein